jgi:peptide/nickel transport system ATP-binding protein
MALLEVNDLAVYYNSLWGVYKVLDGVSLSINDGEVLGIAGESGSGKSTLAEGVLNLVRPPGFVAKGRVLFKGKNLLSLNPKELREIRWKEIAYIPQGSMNSLNPVLKIGDQIADAMLDHGLKDNPKQHVRRLLRFVGLSEDVAEKYPHELSGGMKQRVVIAMATALNPSLIVADEPTTALDIVSQKQVIMELIKLNREYKTAIMFISHDLSIHAQIADRLVMMYAGKIVEVDQTLGIFEKPLHPYTKMLIDSIPKLGKELKGIPGLAPSALNWPTGCRFHPRCPIADDYCTKVEPELKPKADSQEARVACHRVK